MSMIDVEHPDDIMLLLRLRDLRARKSYGEITLTMDLRSGRIVVFRETITIKVPLDNSEVPCHTEPHSTT